MSELHVTGERHVEAPANRVYTEGKGKSQPVKQCTDKNRKALIACLQPNRRVEVEIVGTRAR